MPKNHVYCSTILCSYGYALLELDAFPENCTLLSANHINFLDINYKKIYEKLFFKSIKKRYSTEIRIKNSTSYSCCYLIKENLIYIILTSRGISSNILRLYLQNMISTFTLQYMTIVSHTKKKLYADSFKGYEKDLSKTN